MLNLFFVSIIILVLAIPYAFSAEDLSEKIIQLRNEVSDLSDDFKTEKELLKSKIQTLALEKMDLDSKLRRQNIVFKSLQDKIKEAKLLKNVKRPEFDQTITTYIEFEEHRLVNTLPYKIQERRQHIDKIKNEFLEEKSSADKTMQMLWSHIEDEIQLAKDISLDRDIIVLDGQPTLVEIAKVGMLMLFYKTANNQYGYMEYAQGKWKPSLLASSSSSLLIENFFESLKKQIRTGYFEFPQIPLKPNLNLMKQNAQAGEKNDSV
jgi:hypothetical protein